jgi:hypothetical protein
MQSSLKSQQGGRMCKILHFADYLSSMAGH